VGFYLWQSFVQGFSHILQAFYTLASYVGIPNYGLAIILFTVAVKIVLFPLTLTQMKSMIGMQDLQPKIKQIQEKYKDKTKQQEAMMALYKEKQINPTAGCLPLLVQMPILYALFASLRSFFDPVQHPAYVDLANAGFIWIKNLGQADSYYVLPILTVVATFFQQYITSMTQAGKIDQSQRMMLIIMPIFIGWMACKFPAGLALYWVVYSLWGIVEMFAIRKSIKLGAEKEQST
jgi:YidC/Oxa1 family membrane protein insertase